MGEKALPFSVSWETCFPALHSGCTSVHVHQKPIEVSSLPVSSTAFDVTWVLVVVTVMGWNRISVVLMCISLMSEDGGRHLFMFISYSFFIFWGLSVHFICWLINLIFWFGVGFFEFLKYILHLNLLSDVELAMVIFTFLQPVSFLSWLFPVWGRIFNCIGYDPISQWLIFPELLESVARHVPCNVFL